MPNQALWPKEVRPVNPTSMLRPRAAIARHTIWVAVLVLRPSTRTASGSRTSTTAPMASSGNFARVHDAFIRRASFELLDPLAEEPARPEHQDQEHQHVHRGLARRGREMDGDAAHDAHQQRSENHAPETTPPPPPPPPP